ncbi:unnamed protein product [Calypogeia fissa]
MTCWKRSSGRRQWWSGRLGVLPRFLPRLAWSVTGARRQAWLGPTRPGPLADRRDRECVCFFFPRFPPSYRGSCTPRSGSKKRFSEEKHMFCGLLCRSQSARRRHT